MVLTSKFSASASEIFAGAIQDYHRGLIVGDTPTHGKGTVQSLLDLGRQLFRIANPPDLGALKITMQQFYRPNGDSTQKRGVLADVVLPSLTDHMDVGEARPGLSGRVRQGAGRRLPPLRPGRRANMVSTLKELSERAGREVGRFQEARARTSSATRSRRPRRKCR